MSNRITLLVESYLNYKNTLGYKLIGESYVLRAFARFTEEINYEGALSRDIVFEWCERGTNPSLLTKGRRFEPIKGLADYASSFDSGSEAMPKLPYGNPHKRKRPHIYSVEETCLLMDKCSELVSPDGIRSLTIQTAIGLLWSTGLRPSELIGLKFTDIDFEANIIFVKNSKFNKDRLVPIDTSVAEQLKDYRQKVEMLSPNTASTDSFFVNTNGIPLKYDALRYAFNTIRGCVSPRDSEYKNVRLYDFRHTFATRTISIWLNQNEDVNTKLFILSTYMGHLHPEDTYWYISSTPELLELSSKKYEQDYGGIKNE